MAPLSSGERLQLYQRPDIRHLLSWTIQGHERISPALGKDQDRFPEVSRILGSPESSTALLEELASAGFYQKVKVATKAICPECGDAKISVSQVCPLCESPDIEKADRIEHYACGCIDQEEKFHREGQLICPRCEKELRIIGTDYQRVEDIFFCNQCKRDTSILKVIGRCADHNHTFSYDKVDLKPVYGYVFNESLREEVTAQCLLERPLAEFIESMGYKTETLATLRGGTGAEHTFNIVASGGGKTAVITITSGVDEVGRESVLNFFAELFDVKVDQGILVAMPRLSKDARTLAKLYAINFVEGETIREILDKLPTVITEPRGIREISPETRILQEAIERLAPTEEKIKEETEITPRPESTPVKTIEEPTEKDRTIDTSTSRMSFEEYEKQLESFKERVKKARTLAEKTLLEEAQGIPAGEAPPEQIEKHPEGEDRLEKLRNATLKNLLDLEEWTAQEYSRIAESTPDPRLHELYSAFSEQEKRHRELLSEVASIISPDEEITFTEIPAEIREISGKFTGEARDIYELMLLMETHERLEAEGMKRYQEMAKTTPDERVKKIFQTLIAEHENNHKMFRETLETLDNMYREISFKRRITPKR